MRETLLSFIDDCLVHANEIAIVYWRGLRVSRWTYGQLAGTAFQFARELEARGVAKGDRVIFCGQNSPEWIAAFFGCLLRGAVVVPLDLQSTADFVAKVQEQVAAKLFLTDSTDLKLVLPRICLSDLTDTLSNHPNTSYKSKEISSDDLIEIVFTSGTTAEPKGVCLTHGNLLANLTPIETELKKYLRWERFFHPLRFLCLLPLSHVFGQLTAIFIPQLIAAEVYFRDSFKPSEIVEVVRKQRINAIFTVPRVLESLRDRVEDEYTARNPKRSLAAQLTAAEGRHFLRNWWTFRDVHRRFGWRFWAFISGGATLEADTETFWRRLGFAVIQGYGMTETASLASLSHPFRLVRGSIGKAVTGQEMKLSETGEILIRGANVSPGYWRGGVTPIVDEQGWMHTGDLGEVGSDGNIFFRGRSKEIIVTAAGLKIYPTDLEAALDRQPQIKASVVIPIHGPNGTQAMAVIIPRDADVDVAAAVEAANSSLAEFQKIRDWIVWGDSDFPRTTGTGKIKKAQVAQMVGTMSATNTPRSGSLTRLVVGLAGTDTANLDSTATLADDLKLDSLGRVELISAIEDRYQVELDEAAVSAATTIGDIEQLVRRSGAEVVAYPYPAWAMRFPITWIRFIVYHCLLLPLTFLMCRVRVKGVEKISGVTGPALLISNHVTDVDAALIMSALPIRWRSRLAIAMSGEILRDWRYPPPNISWLIRMKRRLTYLLAAAFFNVFSLPKQSGFRRSFGYLGEAMDQGWSVLVFPEGEETKDGLLQPFRTGAGLLVSELNVPVIPIKLDGLFEIKQRRQYFVRPGTVSVTFGEPIQFSADETPQQIIRRLESQVAGL